MLPHFSRRSLLHTLPWLLLGLGLTLTFALQEAIRSADRQTRQAEFVFRAGELADNLQHRLHNYEQALRGASGLFAATTVDRAAFRQYVGSLKLAEQYPGIQGIGFAQFIAPAEKAAHLARIRREGFPDYQLHPAGERETYSSIIYLEPFDWRNQRAFGYDMYAEPTRRAAMERARDEGRTSISGKVRLLQETDEAPQAGFLMYRPVYRHGTAHDTVATRREQLQGWVYAPFRMNDLLQGILGQHFGELSSTLNLEIYDGPGTDPAQRMFTAVAAPEAALPLRSTHPLRLFGHQWTVVVTALPGFTSHAWHDRANLLAVAGTAGSALLAWTVWLLLSARRRALDIASRITEELRTSEAEKDALFEHMGNGLAILEPISDGSDFRFTAYNQAAERIDRRPRTEVLGQRLSERFPESRANGLLATCQQVWHSGQPAALPATYYADERSPGWREHDVYRLPNGRVAVLFADVSPRQQAKAEQDKLNRALRLLSACNMALVHATDEYKLLAEICHLIVERGGYRMAWVGYVEHDEAKTVRPVTQFGYEQGYLDTVNITWADNERGRGPTGRSIREARPVVNQNVLTNPDMAPWRAAALERGYQSSIALPLINEGQVLGSLAMYSTAPNAFTADEVDLLLEMATDLAFGIATLRRRGEHAVAAERVAFLAHYDPLTHLPNRLLLRDRFAHAQELAEHSHSGIALLYLDLDNFKEINDSLGHDIGDRLLVEAVARLQQCVRHGDTLSRLSGDEFVIVLSAPDAAEIATSVATAIIDRFTEPFAIDQHQLGISFSIGISLCPTDSNDFDTLLQQAGTAVNHAKESGRNTYRFFTLQMNRDALPQMRLKGQLHRALKNGEFLLHYQPQIDIGSGRIIGAEALIRWQHPEDGLVPPGKFIPLAEQSGHIVEIGAWVLAEACRQAMQWRADGLPPLVVAVNLSALQFQRGNVLELVRHTLVASGLPPACLELELTESILVQDVDATLSTLRELKALGIQLSIDDFGTGYSSLAYLKQFALDKLKIDQSFVRDLLEDEDDAAIVQAIIQLGHSLDLTVIAEGVETAEQLAFLGQRGCDEAQGYLIARPLPAAQLAERLHQQGAAQAPQV